MSWDFDYTSVSAISTLLEENGLGMTKKFGQNFLVNRAALEKTVQLAGINREMSVWEIGPGIGALTSLLLETGADVTAFEIDHGFCRILREKAFPDPANFTLVESDALKTWKTVFDEKGCPDVICANLPYNIGSVLIADFIENRCLPQRMVYTLQSEVVRRICSKPGQADYSGFSVLTSIDYESRQAMTLKSGSFWPAPNVESAVVIMGRKTGPVIEEELVPSFIKLTKILFSSRRKTVKNNLRALGKPSLEIEAALGKAGIEPSERAENLSPGRIALLTSALTPST